jgi:hypothetical protein
MFLPGTHLIAADRHGEGMILRTERESILARVVVNAAGLYAGSQTISASMGLATDAIQRDVKLMGWEGPGWVDAHLLASARLAGEMLWTLDGPLRKAARTVGVSTS